MNGLSSVIAQDDQKIMLACYPENSTIRNLPTIAISQAREKQRSSGWLICRTRPYHFGIGNDDRTGQEQLLVVMIGMGWNDGIVEPAPIIPS
jgi:hypothetical protein